jgi:hypothetical protein
MQFILTTQNCPALVPTVNASSGCGRGGACGARGR